MLSDRSKAEVAEAKQEFLQTGGGVPAARDKFTMAVLSELSKQSTVRVLRSTQSSNQVQDFARRTAIFLEQRVTSSAWNQLNNRTGVFALKLPGVIDPAGGSFTRFGVIFAVALLLHKRFFKLLKQNLPLAQRWFAHSKHVLFLAKQTSRFAMVFLLLARYLIGNGNNDQEVVAPPPTQPSSTPTPPPASPPPPQEEEDEQTIDHYLPLHI